MHVILTCLILIWAYQKSLMDSRDSFTHNILHSCFSSSSVAALNNIGYRLDGYHWSVPIQNKIKRSVNRINNSWSESYSNWTPIVVVKLNIIVNDFILLFYSVWFFLYEYIDGLVQDCGDSIANALELLKSCTDHRKKMITCMETVYHLLLSGAKIGPCFCVDIE